MSKNTFVDKAQITIANSKTKFFNFANEPLGSCLKPLSFSSFFASINTFCDRIMFSGRKCRYFP